MNISDFKPSPIARDTDKSRALAKFGYGPVGSGKTSSMICWRAFRRALAATKAGVALRGVIIRDTYRNLEDTTMKTWEEWFPVGQAGRWKGGPVKDYVLPMRMGEKGKWIEHEFLFRHGQTGKQASNFLGGEFGFVALEEVAPAFTPTGIVSPGISEEVFDICIQRARQKGVEPEICLTANTPPTFHWSYKRFLKPSTAELAAARLARFFFPREANEKNLRPGYYDDLRAALKGKDTMIKRFVDGEIVAVYPGLPVYAKDFSERLHVRDGLRPIPKLPLRLCVDSSGLAPAALITQIDHKGRWLWLKEIQAGYIDGRLQEQIGAKRFAQICKNVARENFPDFKFDTGYGDPFALNAKSQTDEKTWAECFAAEGFRLDPGAESIAERTEGVRARLTAIVEGEPGLLIDRDGCPLAIEALAGGYRYGLDPNASRVTGAEPVKNEFSHVMDAAGHAAPKLFPFTMMLPTKTHVPRVRGAMAA